MNKSPKELKFQELYVQWVEPLFRFVYFKSRNQERAEDVVQETFVKFWDKMETIKIGSEKSYLFTTAKNILLNKIAHDKVVSNHSSRLSQAKVDTPLDELEKNDFQNRLEIAIHALPVGQKEVFLMSRIEGYKYKEIADILGISQKAVEKRMSLALKELRKLHKKI